VLLVAHRAPPCPDRCAALGASGADVFELDLQVAGDEIVISHYLPVLPGLLPHLRHDRWTVRWGPVGAGARRLHDAVASLPAGGEILLDLKNQRQPAARTLTDLVLRADLDPARCYVSSAQWPVLEPLRRAGFRTWRTVREPGQLLRVLDGRPTGDAGVTVQHNLLRGRTVARLRRRAGTVITWTVNSPRRAAQLAEAGVDGVTSDSRTVLHLLRAGSSLPATAASGRSVEPAALPWRGEAVPGLRTAAGIAAVTGIAAAARWRYEHQGGYGRPCRWARSRR
jgi:hypothetical protein